MKSLFTVLLTTCTLTLSGCAAWKAPVPGTPQQDVIARLGKPSHVYSVGQDKLLEYGAGSFGQYSYMARIGPDGKLVSYQQTWTMDNFQSIQAGVATKQDVLHLVGHPTEVVRYARVPYEVWNYGYKETGVWNSMMSIYFDDNGIVKKLENGPDPRYDEMRFSW